MGGWDQCRINREGLRGGSNVNAGAEEGKGGEGVQGESVGSGRQ